MQDIMSIRVEACRACRDMQGHAPLIIPAYAPPCRSPTSFDEISGHARNGRTVQQPGIAELTVEPFGVLVTEREQGKDQTEH